MKIADKVSLQADPYQAAIAQFEIRTYDRAERTVTFQFSDESSLTFKIIYEVLQSDN